MIVAYCNFTLFTYGLVKQDTELEQRQVRECFKNQLPNQNWEIYK